MQLNENIILPYPCLNVNIADEDKSPSIEFEIIQRNFAYTTFRAKTTVENEAIQKLIETGKAKYCCELECKRVFYREAFLNETGCFTIPLENQRFNGQILGTLSVVAVESISHYFNSAFDSFYRGFDINIEPSEALAFLGTFEITMEEKSLEVKNIADDFIEVVQDETLKYSRFDLGGDKILLKLPTSLYERYQNPKISENRTCEAFLHASFLLNVLTTALQSIGSYSSTRWAESLHHRIETEDDLRAIVGEDAFDAEGNLENPDNALDIAQSILANPYERMFDSLETNEETDDYE